MTRTIIGLFLSSSLFFLPSHATAQDQDKVRDLVVKIHAVRRTPNVFKPWTNHTPQQIKGSGVIITGKRILTNAHVVRYASQIYVQPNQSADKISAHVIAIAPSMDLAVLSLEDESFFDNRGALPFASELPRVKERVNVYGYPTGGSELSVTQGIVSRIEYTDYYYLTTGLRIQVDAALNFGNSGGPAVSDGKLVGLVYSLIQNAQSIGYLIPVEEIELFLADVADGTYDGKPQLFDFLRPIENDALRQRLALPKDVNGVLVAAPYRNDPSYPLKQWDVITRVGDQPIDSDGKVAVRYDLRLSALYLVPHYAKNGTVGLTVFREGRFHSLNVPVLTKRELAMPYLLDRNPRYFIYGPIVFSQATQEFAERLRNQSTLELSKEASPLVVRRFDRPRIAGEEIIVVASPMFPHRIAKGYNEPYRSVLSTVNGVKVNNLRQLVEILRDNDGPQVTLSFVEKANHGPDVMVFNRAEILAATEDVLEDNGIRYPYSPDLRAVWEKRLTVSPRTGSGS